jgi:purine-nucleoside phosphorylase
MLVAHHLEYASLVFEQENISINSGSYKDIPLAVVFAGNERSEFLSCLRKLIGNGVLEIIYIDACVSHSARYPLRSVILASGGSKNLHHRASFASKQYNLPVLTVTVLRSDSKLPIEGCITDEITEGLYLIAQSDNIDVISVLTVSENTATGEKMEAHEYHSRFHTAARLAFETIVM